MSAVQSASRHSLRQQGLPPIPETEDDSNERSEGSKSEEEFQSGQPRGTALTDDEVFEQSSASLSEVIVLLNRVTKRLDGLDARLDKVEVSLSNAAWLPLSGKCRHSTCCLKHNCFFTRTLAHQLWHYGRDEDAW